MRSFLLLSVLLPAFCYASDERSADWLPLFDGKTLDGWRASESQSTFSVAEGSIVAHGDRSHLFYVGPIAAHDWTSFELTMEVMTSRSANSGIYFHTTYQENGFPEKGYQVQINNSNPYPSKTASLYGVDDRLESPVEDDVWFQLTITVDGNRIVTRVDGRIVCDYVEPENPRRNDEVKGSLLSHGTFALQGHDAESKVRFRNIRVRTLDVKRPNKSIKPMARTVTPRASVFTLLRRDRDARARQFSPRPIIERSAL